MTRTSRQSRLAELCVTMIVIIVGGCAPPRFSDGVAWEIQRSGTTNAAWQFVRDRPCLRVNPYLLDRLKRVEQMQELPEAQAALSEAVDAAFAQAQYAFNNEIDRLGDSALRFLSRHYGLPAPTARPLRQAVRRRFWQEAKHEHQRLQQSIAGASSLADLHALARNLARAALASPKDRRGGGPLLALVAASIEEDTGPLDCGGPNVDLYEPGTASTAFTRIASRSDAALLRRYAPIIVQERIADAPYEPDTDLIGTVRLSGTRDRPRVEIDTAAPTVYGYVQGTWINGREHVQLTYTHWFPRHRSLERRGSAKCASCGSVPLKAFDAEAGRIEGATLRITLDQEQRPAIFETVLNCGCYHHCYVSRSIESASCDEYGAPEAGKALCVERIVDGKMDWILPETVDVSNSSERPLLFSRAGYHGLAGVSFDESVLADRNILAEHGYTLEPYETLERLPIGSGYASMFGADGLVLGAGRLEGALLALTGMRSAGQPRQRGTQLLHWDQYDFDDPHLLERCLRLPSGL